MPPTLPPEFDAVIDEFTDRLNRGENPRIDEYAARHPTHAAELREILGMLAALGPLRSGDTPLTPNPAGRTVPHGPAAPAPAVPGFEILGELGRGGMGVVYKARQTSLNRVVALKVILTGAHATAAARTRFAAEATVLAGLDQPHVVKVFDFGTHDGNPYFALEYVPGGTLESLLAAGPLPPPDAARLVEQLAGAIAHTHAAGVVHRDLKPGNVLLANAERGTRNAESKTLPGDTPSGLSAVDSEFRVPRSALFPKVTDFGLARDVTAGSGLTATGAIVGTPSYMAPEQASGGGEVGPAADVYALGAILYECLTARPPFRGATVLDTLQQVKTRDPVAVRDLQPGVPRDLETICLKCLQKEPAKRYGTAAELAADLRRFLDGRPIVARPVGPVERSVKWTRRNPGKAAAVLAVCAAVTAAFVLQRAWADQKVQAETKRLADLRAADEEAYKKQRETRADAFLRSIAGEPRLVEDLAEVRDLVRERLTELAAQPITTRAGLNARLALLAEEPARAGELAAYLPTCRPEELLPIRGFLKPHAAAVTPHLLAQLADERADAGRRVRAACALAGLAPDDPLWATNARTVATLLVAENPLRAASWAQALDPVRVALVPELTRRYSESRAKLEPRGPATAELAAEVTAFDLAANMLARFAVDQPAALAELAVTADARHYPLFDDSIRVNRAAVVPLLQAEVARQVMPKWAADGKGPFVAMVAGTAIAHPWLDPEPVLVEHGRRRGFAAAALLALSAPEVAWPVFRSPADGDPTARSYLPTRLPVVGADPHDLIRRFASEDDMSARRALVLALGDFRPESISPDVRGPFRSALLKLYRTDPDAGMHSAIDWLLRQKWGAVDELAAIDADLARQWTGGRVPRGRGWFVNGQGQTFAYLRGEFRFPIGSPLTEPGRHGINEAPFRRLATMALAVSTREVTRQEFDLFVRESKANLDPFIPDESASESDAPTGYRTWYQCAAYCNWLSQREGIPPEQWCYEPNPAGRFWEGMKIKPNYNELSGYRLPREFEWECVCRAGTVTSRYYGRGDELMPRYARVFDGAGIRRQSCGRLRPNDWGLFDTLGNVEEWCADPAFTHRTAAASAKVFAAYLTVLPIPPRNLRGGGYNTSSADVRCALHHPLSVVDIKEAHGFRVVRTILD